MNLVLAMEALPGREQEAIALCQAVLRARCLTARAALQAIDPVHNELAIAAARGSLGYFLTQLGRYDEALHMHQTVRTC